jgi:hypothetical protein
MNFWYQNQVDLSATLTTDTTHQTGYPGSNVANDQKTIVWITGTSQATESVIFDFGTSKTYTDAIIFAHNLTAGDSDIELETSDLSDFSVLNQTGDFTWSAGAMHISGTFNGRYARISFTKSAAGQTRQIGRVYLGNIYSTTRQPDFDKGFKLTAATNSQVNESRGAQEYGLVKQNYRLPVVTWTMLENTQSMALLAIYQDRMIAKKLWIQIDASSAQAQYSEIIYVRITEFLQLEASAYDSNQQWDTGMAFREQL